MTPGTYFTVSRTRLGPHRAMLLHQDRGRTMPPLELARNGQAHHAPAHHGMGKIRMARCTGGKASCQTSQPPGGSRR